MLLIENQLSDLSADLDQLLLSVPEKTAHGYLAQAAVAAYVYKKTMVKQQMCDMLQPWNGRCVCWPHIQTQTHTDTHTLLALSLMYTSQHADAKPITPTNDDGLRMLVLLLYKPDYLYYRVVCRLFVQHVSTYVPDFLGCIPEHSEQKANQPALGQAESL